MRFNHTMVSSLGMISEVVVIVIRQYALKNCLWHIYVFGCEKETTMWGDHSCFFIMTHIDSVKQNIQLVSSLL